jgi:hypothetical protein
MRVQERLSELELLNDRRAAEVRQAQERFALAMDQVSGMQTRLLDSEERRRELETAIDVIQLSLRDMRQDRDAARQNWRRCRPSFRPKPAPCRPPPRGSGSWRDARLPDRSAANDRHERDESRQLMAEAMNEVEALNFQSALASERQERVFRQIEDAVAMSMEPLDEMFRAAGLADRPDHRPGARHLFRVRAGR